MNIECIVCKKIVYLKPSRIKNGAKFYSRECHNEFQGGRGFLINITLALFLV